MHKKLDLENTRIKNINIIYRMAKRTVTKHRRKLRNNKSRSKRRIRGGGGWFGFGSSTTSDTQQNQQYSSQNTNTPSNFNKMSTEGNLGMQSMNNYDSGDSRVLPSPNERSMQPSVPINRRYNMGGKRRRPRRSARKVKRSVRKGRKSRRTRRMRGGSNGYTINGAGIGKYTSALANPIPFSGYPLNR